MHSGLAAQVLLAVGRQMGHARQVVVAVHLIAAMFEEFAPFATRLDVPADLLSGRPQNPRQIVTQERLEVRPQIGHLEGRGGGMRAQPDFAALHLDLQITDRVGPADRFELQRVQQHLDAMRQLERFASFQIQDAGDPAAATVPVDHQQIGMIVADHHQVGIQAVSAVECARQPQGRLIEKRSGFGVAQPPQRLPPIEAAGMDFARAVSDPDAACQVLLQHRPLPGVAAFQNRLDHRAVIEVGRRQVFRLTSLLVGRQEPEETLAVVEEVTRDRGRTGSERRRARAGRCDDTHCRS
jgi:hypothetical protein